jgi:hypothetical protein
MVPGPVSGHNQSLLVGKAGEKEREKVTRSLSLPSSVLHLSSPIVIKHDLQ